MIFAVTPDAGAACRLSGTVLTDGDASHSGSVLTLCDLDGVQVGRSFVDGSGGYTLSAPRPGRYLLLVQARGRHPQAHVLALSRSRTVRVISLERLHAQVAGEVRAFPSGVPVPGAVVVATDATGEVRDSTRAGPDGRYALGGLAEGPHTITGAAEHMWPAAVGVHVPGTGRTIVRDLDMLEPIRPPDALRGIGDVAALPPRWAAAKQDAAPTEAPTEPPIPTWLADR
jgi:hypothetical protein